MAQAGAGPLRFDLPPGGHAQRSRGIMTDEPPEADLSPSVDLDFHTIDLRASPDGKAEIEQLLHENDLELEDGIDIFVVGRDQGRLVGCAGLDRDVIKDVAVAPHLRGSSVSLRLGSEVLKLAAEAGHHDLFLYCRPDNVKLFRGWAFFPLVEVAGTITLMENNPMALRSYCGGLAADRHPGERIGGIVLNANPFTLGHRHLVEKAAAECDWLHVFVVKEDASQFSYADRFQLVSEGLGNIGNVTVHHGSKYIISRETFPGYFLKQKATIESSFSGIDLLMFREHIAPALGINRRYVGTEPLDRTTQAYNAAMKHWLSDASSAAPPVEVVVIDRLETDGTPVSASAVREKLAQGDMGGIEALVPSATLAFLRSQAASLRGDG